MIKLQLNKIPGYTIDPTGYVIIAGSDGCIFNTCMTLEQIQPKEPEPEPEPEQEAEVEVVHKVTEETLLKTIAMLHGVKEIPK